MGFFQWAVLGIGIAIIILLSVIVYYLKQIVPHLYAPHNNRLSQLELIRESITGCYSILKDINDDRAREHLKREGLIK